jgi:hypothetical protein
MQQALAARPAGLDSAIQRNHASRVLQRDARTRSAAAAQPDLIHGVLNSPGRPLDPATRGVMEPQLGHDLSGVRVHSDADAAEAARSVNATAFTAGNHVVFGSGRYAPGTPSGQRMLAHELTHVRQQARGPVSGTAIGNGLSVSDPHDAFEREARANADRIAIPGSAASHAAPIAPRPAGSGSDGVHIQRGDGPDAAGIIGAVAGVASVGLAIAALVYAIKAWKHPANAQPTVGGASVNSQNPISAVPDKMPDSAKKAAIENPADHPKLLDMRTDEKNALDIDLSVVSDGVSIFSAVPEIVSNGYSGGTDGSTAVLNLGSPTVLTKPEYGEMAEPAPAKEEPKPAPKPATKPAPAKAAGKGKKEQKSEPEKQPDPQPKTKAKDTPALIQVPFTGLNSVNETKPQQQFSGRFVMRGDGSVKVVDCYSPNKIGYAATDGKIGHIDYSPHAAVAAAKPPAPAPGPSAAPAAPHK